MKRLVILSLLLCVTPVHAQQIYKSAASGPVILNFVYNTSPDCTGAGYADVRITQQPQNGRVSVVKTSSFPTFPPSNVRYVCNTRQVPGIEVRYSSKAGFIGTDYVAMESIFPHGTSLTRRYFITVK